MVWVCGMGLGMGMGMGMGGYSFGKHFTWCYESYVSDSCYYQFARLTLDRKLLLQRHLDLEDR